ncbi:reverse transcriptase domain-containing protein [Tanacetum coccineum]
MIMLRRTVSRTGSRAEINIVRPQVHDRGSGDVAMDEGQGADKGVSVKEYLVKTLRPEDDDKALSSEGPVYRTSGGSSTSLEDTRVYFNKLAPSVGPKFHLPEKDVEDVDLKKPFREALRTLLTHRIIEFAGPENKMPTNIKLYDGTTDPKDHLNRFASAANSDEWPMPVWCRMFQQTLDGSARGWFERLLARSINEWYELREAFAARYLVQKACFKEPHEITKIVRRENESLMAFKERWIVKTSFILGVPEVMKISSFMDSLKCPKLAKRYSDKVPRTVEEMMVRLDDFVRSEEAFARTELPKGEAFKHYRRTFLPAIRRDDRPHRNHHRGGARRNEDRITIEEGIIMICTEVGTIEYPILLQEGITKPSHKRLHPAKETARNGTGTRETESFSEGCQIERLVKEKKSKAHKTTKAWMNTPITFPSVLAEDVSENLLIIEAEVEGYLVRRVYVDEGASVEVMFEHCFENLSPLIMARLRYTQTDLENRNEIHWNNNLGHAVCHHPRILLDGEKANDQRKPIKEEKENEGNMKEVSVTEELKLLLKDDMEIFVWEPADMNGVPQRIIEHSLNVNASIEPICQKQRIFAPEKSKAVAREVVEWVKAGIVWPVGYPTWISNPVLVKKCYGAWRMCIDFKNLNSACPKDYYPFPNIDCKVESVMGLKNKFFLDTYKGDH